MKILERLNEEFPEHDWSLKELGRNQYWVMVSDRATVYRYYHFDDMIIPTFSQEHKHSMEEENIEGIIEAIREQGVIFRDEQRETRSN